LIAPSLVRADEPEIQYYDVVGSSDRELRNQMNAKGPMGTRGHRVDGHTHWKTSWRYRYAPSADGCAFTRIDVVVKGTMTLPRWTGEAHASDSLAKNWRSFATALRRHEEGHYAHGLKAREEIEELGRSFRVPGSCATIEEVFREQAKSIIDKYRAADAAYDAETRHGRTQGVRFP
jgi:predicted secreted Zn-dependent protease